MQNAKLDEHRDQAGAEVVGREQGFTLVVALMVMGLLTTLGLSLLFTAETERTMSRNFSGQIQASYAAESVAEAMAGALLFDLTQDTKNGWANEYMVVCDLPSAAACLSHYGFDPTAVACAAPASNKCVVQDTTAAFTGIKDQWVANLRYRPPSYSRPAFPNQLPVRLWGGSDVVGEEGLKDVLVWWKKFDIEFGTMGQFTKPIDKVDHLNTGEAEIALTSVCVSACATANPIYDRDQLTVTGIGTSARTLTGRMGKAKNPATRSVAIKLEGSILGVWGNALVGGGQTTDNDPVINGHYLIRGGVLMFNEDPSKTVLTFPTAKTGVVNNYYDTDSSVNTIDPWWWLDAVSCTTQNCDASNTSLAASFDSDATVGKYTREPIAHHIPDPLDLNADPNRPGGYRSDIDWDPSPGLLYPGPEGLNAIIRVNRGTINVASGLIGRAESNEGAPGLPGFKWDNVLDLFMNDAFNPVAGGANVRRLDKSTFNTTGRSGPFDIDTTVIDFPKLSDPYIEPTTLEYYDNYYDFLRPAAPGTHPGGWALDFTGIDGADRNVGQLNSKDCWPHSAATDAASTPTQAQILAAFDNKKLIQGCSCDWVVDTAAGATNCGGYGTADTATQACDGANPAAQATSCKITLKLGASGTCTTPAHFTAAVCTAPGKIQYTIYKRYGASTVAKYTLPGAENILNFDSSSSIDSPKGRAQATMHESFAYKLYRDVIKAIGNGSCGDENNSVLWTKNLKTLPTVLNQTIPTTYANQTLCWQDVAPMGTDFRPVPCFPERKAYMDVHIQLPQVPIAGQIPTAYATSGAADLQYCDMTAVAAPNNKCGLADPAQQGQCAGHAVVNCTCIGTAPCVAYALPAGAANFGNCQGGVRPPSGAGCGTISDLACRQSVCNNATTGGTWKTYVDPNQGVTATGFATTTAGQYNDGRRWLSVRFRQDGSIVVLSDPRAQLTTCQGGTKTDLVDEIVDRLDFDITNTTYDLASPAAKTGASRMQLQNVDYSALNYPPNYAYAKPVALSDLQFRNMPTGAFVVALHLPCSDELNDKNPYKCSETDGTATNPAISIADYQLQKPDITYRGFYTHIVAYGPKYTCWQALSSSWNDTITGQKGSPHDLAPGAGADSCACPDPNPYGKHSWFAESVMQANNTTLLNTPVLFANGTTDGNPVFQHQASSMAGFKLSVPTNNTGNPISCWDGIDTPTGRKSGLNCINDGTLVPPVSGGLQMAFLNGDGVPCNEVDQCPFSYCPAGTPPPATLNGDESDCLDGKDNGADGVADLDDPDCKCGRDADFVANPDVTKFGWAFGGQTEIFTPLVNRRAGMKALDPRSVIDTPFNRFKYVTADTGNLIRHTFPATCTNASCAVPCYWRGVDPDLMSSWYDRAPTPTTSPLPVFTDDPRNRYDRAWPGWGSVNVLQGAGLVLANAVRFGHATGTQFNKGGPKYYDPTPDLTLEDCTPGTVNVDEDLDGWKNERDPDCNDYMAGYRSDPIVYDGRLIIYAGDGAPGVPNLHPPTPGGAHVTKVFINEHVVPRGVMGCSDFLSVLSTGDTEINMTMPFDGGVGISRHLMAMFSLTNGTLKVTTNGSSSTVQHELVGSWISDSAEFGTHDPPVQIIGIPAVIDLACTHKYLPGDKRVVQGEVLSYMEAETLPRGF